MSFEYLVKNCKDSDYMRQILQNRGVNFVLFTIIVDQRFPFAAPQVHCMSQLSIQYELNDGRGRNKSVKSYLTQS
jgi:hypothetical protein